MIVSSAALHCPAQIRSGANPFLCFGLFLITFFFLALFLLLVKLQSPGMEKDVSYSASTLAVHGDDALNSTEDVAPAMHVSTTFRYTSDPDKLVPFSVADVVRSAIVLEPFRSTFET